MSYFIHNKYSALSRSKVTTSDNVTFTYNDDSTVTVIDYYGLLESGDTTYKGINTSKMGTEVIDNLEYSSIVEDKLVGVDNITNGLSNQQGSTSLLDYLTKIDSNIGVSSDTGTSTLFGYLNTGFTQWGTIKKVQRGTVKFTSTDNKAITISSVNINKTIVILNDSIIGYYCCSESWDYGSEIYGSYVVSLTSTKLTIGANYFYREGSHSTYIYGTTSYQVIEFY